MLGCVLSTHGGADAETATRTRRLIPQLRGIAQIEMVVIVQSAGIPTDITKIGPIIRLRAASGPIESTRQGTSTSLPRNAALLTLQGSLEKIVVCLDTGKGVAGSGD